MRRWLIGDAPMTRAERMARLRAKQPTAPELATVRPEEMAAVILAQSGSAYCRELAKDLLLMAIWADAGRPIDWAQEHADVQRMVIAWCQFRIPPQVRARRMHEAPDRRHHECGNRTGRNFLASDA
jgi:hypothetical protein